MALCPASRRRGSAAPPRGPGHSARGRPRRGPNPGRSSRRGSTRRPGGSSRTGAASCIISTRSYYDVVPAGYAPKREDVLKYIKSNTQDEEYDLPSGIPIYVDPIGLQEAEKTLQSTITLDLEGVPLSRTLHLALKQLGLVYFVDDGLVIITSADSEDKPENFRAKPSPTTPSSRMLLQEKAERGELDAAQRKEFIQMLRDLKEIDALLHDPDYGTPVDPAKAEATKAAARKIQ